jgi:serine palmitoyltransferase
MDHLRTILDSIAKDDKRLRRDATQQRRFIVVEGLYRNTGDLCPLKDILKLKDKYCYRIIMDETLSFGTIGRTGRGVTEHFGVKISDVEVITLAMDTCLASVGGVCIGSREIVDHQRLSGAGYCFSASAPPFLSAVAIEALKTMEEEPERLVKLGEISKLLRDALDKVEGVTLRSREMTPIIHLELTAPLESVEAEAIALTHVAAACVAHGVAISANKFALQNPSKVRPSLTLNASTKLSKGEVTKIAAVLDAALRACEL